MSIINQNFSKSELIILCFTILYIQKLISVTRNTQNLQALNLRNEPCHHFSGNEICISQRDCINILNLDNYTMLIFVNKSAKGRWCTHPAVPGESVMQWNAGQLWLYSRGKHYSVTLHSYLNLGNADIKLVMSV